MSTYIMCAVSPVLASVDYSEWHICLSSLFNVFPSFNSATSLIYQSQ